LRKLRNISELAPLTPNFADTKCGTTFHAPATAPDLKVEEFLFESYLREKARAERFQHERDTARTKCAWLQDSLNKRRKFAKVKRLTTLTPGQGDKHQ
jgi:hypothetical protein